MGLQRPASSGLPPASLSANPTAITAGQSPTLTWSSTNATSCTGTGFSTGNATAGSVTVTPSITTSYSVSCTGSGGTATASATVVVGSGGSLSGSVVTAASSYNLTMLGTSDWTHWKGIFIHKMSGSTQISDVTQIGAGSYGTWSTTSRNASWTDGTPITNATNDENYIWSNGTANSGWTFTAPADTTLRTLHVITGGPGSAIVKITAHLSDGSAVNYTDTKTSSNGFTNEYV